MRMTGFLRSRSLLHEKIGRDAMNSSRKKNTLRGILAGMSVLFGVLFCAISSEAAGFRFPSDEDGELIVVLDPGHGGENLGADYSGYIEKEMNLIVAEAMYEELTKYEGITVYMTRTGDEDLSLKERADFAASVNADYLFCLHFNMSPNNVLYGSEVWIQCADQENREGYQFGRVQMETMAEMGLYIRGVKTRINDRGTDYYGILRHCKEYGIAAALIEHCHVDHENDTAFCDSVEDLKAFGKADATSVAKYFGLSSTILGVDYSDYNLSDLEEDQVYMQPDTTDPEICYVYVDECNYETGEVTLTLTASDSDTPMLYYSYSLDGGISYTPYLKWPQTNIMGRYSPDSFQFTVQVPEGSIPTIIVRAYNQYDRYKESNVLNEFLVFPHRGEDENSTQSDSLALPSDSGAGGSAENETDGASGSKKDEGYLIGGDIDLSKLWQANGSVREKNGDSRFLIFLLLCLFCVLLLFGILLITKIVQSRKRKKKYRRRAAEHNTKR